jgi:hypothetical protein
MGTHCAERVTPSIRKVGTNFADKLWMLGWYSSLVDYRPWSLFLFVSVVSEQVSHIQVYKRVKIVELCVGCRM